MLMFFFYRKVYLMKGGIISVKYKKKIIIKWLFICKLVIISRIM